MLNTLKKHLKVAARRLKESNTTRMSLISLVILVGSTFEIWGGQSTDSIRDILVSITTVLVGLGIFNNPDSKSLE